jgi:hypothetical protein
MSNGGAPFLGSWEPPAGLLRDYELLWLPTTDAPRVYHVAAGLAVIASVVEGHIHLPFGGDRLNPNLWALILGPSSLFRKSSTLSKAKKTLGGLYESGQSPLLPDEFSREALLKRLSERAQGLLVYSEFSGALAIFGRDYMAGTRELLTDLYDSPESYQRVVGQQTWTLNNVCLSVLAASQTDWFLEKLKSGDVRGGFLARFTYWPAFEKTRFIAVPPEPDRVLMVKVLTGLNRVRGIHGAVELAPAEKAEYSRWVESHERELNKSTHLSELSPFWSRLSVTALKLAMLLQVSSNSDLVISREALASALSLTDFLKASLRHLFAEEFAFTPQMQNRQKILRLVRKSPDGISRRDLMRAASLLARDFDAVVSTLIQEERICQRGKTYVAAELAERSVPVSEEPTDSFRQGFRG